MTIRLTRLCESAGLTGADAESAIAAYVRQGELTPNEVEDLGRCAPAIRDIYFANLFGADAARVAALDYTERTQ